MFEQVSVGGRSGAHGVAQVIALQEDAHVFGMPGGHTMNIFDGLRDHQDAVTAVLVREESIATMAAESYGRLTGRAAVAMGQGAWVLGVGGNGIMEAHLGSSPMVVLVDMTEGGSFSHQGPYQSGNGGYGSFDQIRGLEAITKAVFFAEDPVQAVQMTQLAFKHAVAGEPGPVAVVFHSRALLGDISEADAKRIHIKGNYASPVPSPAASDVDAAAALIRASKNPVIVAGNGLRTEPEKAALRAFAEQTGIPVAMTTSGKGVFPESHELAAGVMGSYGQDAANTLVGASDLVLAVGTKLGASDTLEQKPELVNPVTQQIVQIDVEPKNIGWTTPTDAGLVGRASDALPAIAEALAGVSWEGAARVADIRGAEGYFGTLEVAEEPGDGLLSPRRVSAILAELAPESTTITTDAGENRIFMLHDFQTGEHEYLAPNGGGSMGYAVPAAIGATFARPGSLAVAVAGDGGFAMSLHAVMSATENNLNMVVVVMDNQTLGWVQHGQGDRPFMSDFANFDYAEITADLLAKSTATAKSEPELRAALEAAFAAEASGVRVVIARTSLKESFKTISTKLATASHEEL